MNRFRLAFAVIVLLLLITNCFGQASFNGIQRAEGWSVPGLKGSRLALKEGKAISKIVDRGEYDRYLKQFEIHSKWTSPNAEQ